MLGDLCREAETGGYSAATCGWLQDKTGERLDDPALTPGEQSLAQRIVMLRHSRRFAGASGIGCLARAVNDGAAEAARATLQWRGRRICMRCACRANRIVPSSGYCWMAYLVLIHDRWVTHISWR